MLDVFLGESGEEAADLGENVAGLFDGVVIERRSATVELLGGAEQGRVVGVCEVLGELGDIGIVGHVHERLEHRLVELFTPRPFDLFDASPVLFEHLP